MEFDRTPPNFAAGYVPEPHSLLARKIREGFAGALEVDLPRNHDISLAIEATRMLKEADAHVVGVSDGARARLRHPVPAAHRLQEDVNIKVVAHISRRYRNLIGLQADMLGALALGVRNVLAVSGDPARVGVYPEATSVFDTDAPGLVRILSRFNRGEDLSGNPVGDSAGFLIGVAFDPAAEDLDRGVGRLKRKAEAGAHAAWTQPVFERGVLERALERLEDLDPPVLLGLMPLRSRRQAEILHRQVPGIDVPEHVRCWLAALAPEGAPRYGVEVAQERLIEIQALVRGAYIVPPASAPRLAVEVMQVL